VHGAAAARDDAFTHLGFRDDHGARFRASQWTWRADPGGPKSHAKSMHDSMESQPIY
jgi:hypothetical protein